MKYSDSSKIVLIFLHKNNDDLHSNSILVSRYRFRIVQHMSKSRRFWEMIHIEIPLRNK